MSTANTSCPARASPAAATRADVSHTDDSCLQGPSLLNRSVRSGIADAADESMSGVDCRSIAWGIGAKGSEGLAASVATARGSGIVITAHRRTRLPLWSYSSSPPRWAKRYCTTNFRVGSVHLGGSAENHKVFESTKVDRGLRLGTAHRRAAGPAHPPRPHPGNERRELPPQAQ